jgi:hypothetical protein
MRLVLAAILAVGLGAVPASAASPKVETAIKVFQAVGADANKMKTFCTLTKTLDSMGDKDDPKVEAQVAALIKQLGPDFETAWAASDDLDENSPDAKAFEAALEAVSSKCPQ